MKKLVLVFIFNEFADWEPAYICPELNSPETEYTVKTISLDREPKVSMGGFTVLPDYSVEDFPEEFSLLVLCGGLAWMEQKNNGVLPLVDYAVKKQIPVGAICNATNFMAENRYLDNRKHTGNTLGFMKAQAPHYRGEGSYMEKQSVCNGGIITANGSGTLEFARDILLLLKVKPEQKIAEWYHFNKHGYYQE